MLTVFWGSEGIVLTEYLERIISSILSVKLKISEDFKLESVVFVWVNMKSFIMLGNAFQYIGSQTRLAQEPLNFQKFLPHPPHSSSLVISDFFSLSTLLRAFKVIHFKDGGKIQAAK